MRRWTALAPLALALALVAGCGGDDDDSTTTEAATTEAAQKTRHYAKRQMTWFAKERTVFGLGDVPFLG